jgi:16S rRNA C967 or C1407 C5-methylase (RsmB/RsmF family)/NOL1/NOP2/fmu family ribosome biogenesis protein
MKESQGERKFEMLPEEFIHRLGNQKYIDNKSLLKAIGEPSPVSIRINSSKWDKKPLNSESVPWCKNGYYLNSRPSYTLDPLHHSGCYYPQEASGMFLEQAVRQTVGSLENIRVLDLCGAPGGKSTLLSDIIGPGNLLVTNEVIGSRASILAETITKWGSANTIVTGNDPAVFGRLPGYFDIILVDAPCSGEGMFRNKVAVSEWSPGNAAHCSERQKRILMDVWPALKENGILIYSTCTFNPGENEENIKWLTCKHDSESIELNVTDFKGITKIDYQGIFGYGFYPGKVSGDGFFISVIRKCGKQEKIQVKRQTKPVLIPDKDNLTIASEWSHFPKNGLIKWGNEVYAVPCDMNSFLHLFQNLKIIKPGTKIFTVKKSDYLPSCELALSGNLRKDSFPIQDVSLPVALAFLRRDNFTLNNSPVGWNIVTYKGVNLGFVKNIGNRVNNYYPVGWRIRMSLPEPGTENIIKWESNDSSIS